MAKTVRLVMEIPPTHLIAWQCAFQAMQDWTQNAPNKSVEYTFDTPDGEIGVKIRPRNDLQSIRINVTTPEKIPYAQNA